MLTDRQPVSHQGEPQNSQTPPDSVQDIIEISEIRQISDLVTVNTIIPEEQCAQNIISVTEVQHTQNINSVSEEQCAQRHISISNTTEIEVEIHAEESAAQPIVHFREAHDQSECGSLTTQAPSRARYALRSTLYRHGYQQSNRTNHGISRGGSKTHQ